LFLISIGDSLRKIEKAAKLNADSICLDIEDGVSINSKVTFNLKMPCLLVSYHRLSTKNQLK